METNPRISPPDDFPYPCTSAYGRDRYGIWQTVEVAGVGQTFRWIPPGQFIMGSPGHEAGRFPRETQHQVTLTHGYWLADTTCTQALWTALMDYNPSEPVAAEKPVVNVSFHTVGEFLDRWNTNFSSFLVRLPSEAEWEYACRAATSTAFSFGNTVSRGQVNFKEKTRYDLEDRTDADPSELMAVKELSPNQWGLYHMHGNVREWCRDWFGILDLEDAVDPLGPEYGHSRVLRGGMDSAIAARLFAARTIQTFRVMIGVFGLPQGPLYKNEQRGGFYFFSDRLDCFGAIRR